MWTTTNGIPARTTRGTSSYYLVLDELTNVGMCFRYDKATGISYQIGAYDGEALTVSTTLASGYTLIPGLTLNPYGKWIQTVYTGSTKESATEVTLSTGTEALGFVTHSQFTEVVGTEEFYTQAQTIKGAIAELDNALRPDYTYSLTTTSKNAFGAINEHDSEIGQLSALKTETKSSLVGAINELFDIIYPVGSIFLSASSTINPQTLFGGTWEKISSGKCLWGSDETHSAGNTIEAGLPFPSIKSSGSHTHYWNGYYGLGTTNDKYCRSRYQLSGDPTEAMTRNDGAHTHTFNEDSIYKSTNTTVQPPAFVVDIWKRTA